jgi:microcystin-dependent protein
MSNNGGVYTWSKTPASNASADATVNYLEGQAPSSLNDSARAAMASVAKYRDDISGAILTTGTSVAYIVASNQVFDTLADFHGQVIAFTPHVTNTAGPVTVTVDGFANLPLRTSPGKELLTGTLIQGTPYTATYNNVDGALYLHGFYGVSPYLIPLAAGMDFWGTTAPNSSFAFPIGQAISRTTYAPLFAIMGTTYGVGDGSTTFNLPDKTGRVSAMIEAVATRLTAAGSGVNGGAMGGNGGAQNKALLQSDLPNVNVPGVVTDPGHFHSIMTVSSLIYNYQGVGAQGAPAAVANTDTKTTGISVATRINGNVTQTALGLVQPTIVCNYIIRVI